VLNRLPEGKVDQQAVHKPPRLFALEQMRLMRLMFWLGSDENFGVKHSVDEFD